jgi:hypothetical protein
MSLVDISHARSPALLPWAIPARPYRGTSFSSLTTMLRSASLAAFDILRVCCCSCCSGARLSRLWRATRRMHELHWGSSVDRLSEAIAGCVVHRSCLVLPKKRCRSVGRTWIWRSNPDPCDGQARRWPALGNHSAAAASPSKQVMTASVTVQLPDSDGG